MVVLPGDYIPGDIAPRFSEGSNPLQHDNVIEGIVIANKLLLLCNERNLIMFGVRMPRHDLLGGDHKADPGHGGGMTSLCWAGSREPGRVRGEGLVMGGLRADKTHWSALRSLREN